MESGASRQIMTKFFESDVSILSFSSDGFTSSQIEPDVSHNMWDKSGDFSTRRHASRVAFISASRWSFWRFKYSENDIPPNEGDPGFPRKLDKLVKLSISNPSSKFLNFVVNTKSDIIIYNVIGEEVRRYNNVNDALKITSESLGSGVFYVSFYSNFNIETHKIIIKSWTN